MRPNSRVVSLALVGIGWIVAVGSEPATSGLPVRMTRLNGALDRGQLVQLTPEIAIQTADGLVAVAWTEVLSVEPELADRSLTDSGPAGPLLFLLADRSRLPGAVVGTEEGGFRARLARGPEARIPLSAVQSIRVVSADPAGVAELDEALRRQAGSQAGGGELLDVAVVARGDKIAVLSGRIKSIGPEHVMMEWNKRDVPLPWSRLVGLGLARPAPQTASCTVRLLDGAVVAGRIVGGSTAEVRLRSGLFDAELELSWAQIERIDCHSDRLVLLSELRPVRYQFEPFFDKHWRYAVDQSLTGAPVMLGQTRFVRAIVMHSRASLTYRIDGGFAQFAAEAGVLDETGGRGCVTLRVLGDGQAMWEARGVRGGQRPQSVLVDVRGVTELTLEVDFDEELDLADQAAFGFARLIR